MEVGQPGTGAPALATEAVREALGAPLGYTTSLGLPELRRGIAGLYQRWYGVDLDPARRLEMMEKTARRTVPQIYIGETHVGGCDDLIALDHAGKLDALLRGEAA